MKTKSERRRLAEAGAQRTLTSSILMGLGAASLMLAGQLPRPLAPKGDIDDDWRAISADIALAARKHASRT